MDYSSSFSAEFANLKLSDLVDSSSFTRAVVNVASNEPIDVAAGAKLKDKILRELAQRLMDLENASGPSSVPSPALPVTATRFRQPEYTAEELPSIDQSIEKMGTFVTGLGNSTASPEVMSSREMKGLRSDEKHAAPLERELRRWVKLLPENRQSEVRVDIWRDLESRFPNARNFSVLLSKLTSGFSQACNLPHFSWSRLFHIPKKYVFAEERLLPVLLAMQNKPVLAERLFSLAEDGLGACNDRPVLTFVDIELEVLSDTAASKMSQVPKRVNIQFIEMFNDFISVEHQKLRKSLVVSGLIEQFKTQKGGRVDPLENVVHAYRKIAKKIPHLFPPAPYRACATFVNDDRIRSVKNQAISSLQKIDFLKTRELLVGHLMSSDNWLKLLVKRDPELGRSLQRIEQQRTRLSENLLDLPANALQSHYATDIAALESAYNRHRSRLLNHPLTVEFTKDQVDRYFCYRVAKENRQSPRKPWWS